MKGKRLTYQLLFVVTAALFLGSCAKNDEEEPLVTAIDVQDETGTSQTTFQEADQLTIVSSFSDNEALDLSRTTINGLDQDESRDGYVVRGGFNAEWGAAFVDFIEGQSDDLSNTVAVPDSLNGWYAVEIDALDVEGNLSQPVSFAFQVINSNAPTIVVTQLKPMPVDTAWVVPLASSPKLQGTVTDPTGLTEVTVRFTTTTGSEISSVSRSYGGAFTVNLQDWDYTLPFTSSDEYWLQITATNTLGLSTQHTIWLYAE